MPLVRARCGRRRTMARPRAEGRRGGRQRGLRAAGQGDSGHARERATAGTRTHATEPRRVSPVTGPPASHQNRKHYLGPQPCELAELTSGGNTTEEFKCAQFLDGLAEVEFWVRNLARKATSFRLQTSKDWFYPDFVCRLRDRRSLVVEYKGAHLWTDAEEKRAIGAVWASRSGGRCLFVMPTDGDFSAISKAVRGS